MIECNLNVEVEFNFQFYFVFRTLANYLCIAFVYSRFIIID
jgi:hypothetical protein